MTPRPHADWPETPRRLRVGWCWWLAVFFAGLISWAVLIAFGFAVVVLVEHSMPAVPFAVSLP